MDTAGLGDGRPTLPTGEPVLARWFVLVMLVGVPVGVGVVVWAFASLDDTTLAPAARRPPGSAAVTHDRGEAALGDVRETEAGPGCASGVTLVGDVGARATGRIALSATCQLLELDRFATARQGLARWAAEEGVLRMAVFEVTGLDSSTRREEGRLVIELNAKFQFQDATRAAPVVIHELVHLADGMPGAVVTAPAELRALTAQHAACQHLNLRGPAPRGCRDATQVVGGADPLADLREAGYPPA